MYEITRLAETISKNLPGSQGLALHYIPCLFAAHHSSTFFLCCVPSLPLLPFLYLILGLFIPLPSGKHYLKGWFIQRWKRIPLIWKLSSFLILLRRYWLGRWWLNEKDKWSEEWWMVQVLIRHQGQMNWFVDLFYLWELNCAGKVQTCYPSDMTSTITCQQQVSPGYVREVPSAL